MSRHHWYWKGVRFLRGQEIKGEPESEMRREKESEGDNLEGVVRVVTNFGGLVISRRGGISFEG